MSIDRYQQFNLNSIDRRKFLKYGGLGVGSSILAACNSNPTSPIANNDEKSDKINFGINWVAEAEYGGYYQAVATGIYKAAGLDVTIKQGGPRINVGLLLMLGGIDLAVGSGFEAITAIESGLPKVVVASIFQKCTNILMVHRETGVTSIPQLKGKPVYVGSGGASTYWPFLRTKYGFNDSQKRPYQFDVAPFLADKSVAMQGLLTSEPFTVEKKGGFKPVVLLLADAGFNPYEFTIETTRRLVETKPELVQRFVDASIKGWYSYLADPAPGNALIKKDNPEMTDELLSYSLARLKEANVIVGGDAASRGIGSMSDTRWKTLFDDMVKAGVYKANTNYQEAYTLQFVNKGADYYQKG
jgi:NitT/TauT family transport system substrate-binding protein